MPIQRKRISRIPDRDVNFASVYFSNNDLEPLCIKSMGIQKTYTLRIGIRFMEFLDMLNSVSYPQGQKKHVILSPHSMNCQFCPIAISQLLETLLKKHEMQ